MINSKKTLVDRLDNIVDIVHIAEVKQIINTLSKINNFKHIIEDDLCSQSIYNKIAYELKHEFKINNIKIVQLNNSEETILYQLGDTDMFTYTHISKVAPNISIIIFIEEKKLTPYEELSLNSYFNEIVHLLYIQFILNDMKAQTLRDPLTGLKNRISFTEEMKVLVPLALREKMNIAALLVNIDRFTAVNDEHGNEFGDEFLKLYADIITETIRTSDIAVRFAGGEFLILLVNVESELKAMEIAKKIQDKLAQAYLLTSNNDKFQKTVSIGVSIFPDDSENMEEIVKYASIALSDARDQKRNNILRYENVNQSMIELF